MHNPGINPVTGKITGKHLQVPNTRSPSKFDSNGNSDSDGDSPDLNSSKFGQLTPRISLNNVPQLEVQRYSPEVTPNSDNDSDSPPHLPEDDFDEEGEDSFSDAGDNNEATTPSPAREISPSSSASPSSSSELHPLKMKDQLTRAIRQEFETCPQSCLLVLDLFTLMED